MKPTPDFLIKITNSTAETAKACLCMAQNQFRSLKLIVLLTNESLLKVQAARLILHMLRP